MNQCVLEVVVRQAPTIRYTQDNKTPIAEMEVEFEALRADDPKGVIKAIGWGNLAQDLQNTVQASQRLVLEGHLRMNTVPRQDGTKEKKAEFTLTRFHQITETAKNKNDNSIQNKNSALKPNNSVKGTSVIQGSEKENNQVSWDSSPLIPETDEIPF